MEFSKKVAKGAFSWNDLMEGILIGDENWDAMYNDNIDEFETNILSPTTDWHVELILMEKDAYELLWHGQPLKAADKYAILAEKALRYDYRLSAWYSHWRGLSLLCGDDNQGALHEFISAANARSELGRPSTKREFAFKSPTPIEIGQQSKNLADMYRKRKVQIPVNIQQIETDLKYGPDTNKAEEACRLLGHILGLQTKRPDKSSDTGPDVTWAGEGHIFPVGFELKTNKDKGGEYSKKDISQCHDHLEWMSNHYDGEIDLIILGPTLPVSNKSNPPGKLKIVEVESIRDLLIRAKNMFNAVESGDRTNLEKTFQTWLDFYGLNWPICIQSLDSRLAIDLKET